MCAVNVVIFTGWKYCENVAKTFHGELCPKHDVVTILSISYRYVYFMLISYIHFYYKESIFRRHRFDIVTISSCNCLINCIAVDIVDIIDIDSISFHDCWISCIVVDIDTISFHDCWISCIVVNFVDIDTISFHDCRISWIAVDIIDIYSISFHDCWINCITCTVDIDTISFCDCWINCILALNTV